MAANRFISSGASSSATSPQLCSPDSSVQIAVTSLTRAALPDSASRRVRTVAIFASKRSLTAFQTAAVQNVG